MLELLMIAAAVAPALLLVRYFRRLDLFPEPDEIITRTFFLGVAAIVPVVVVVLLVQAIRPPPATALGHALYMATIASAIPEEAIKFLILYHYVRHHSEFDEPMDGLVYGATASLGFACLENVLYVIGAGDDWMAVAVVRGLLAVPSHGLGGVIMGFYFGRAHFEPDRRRLDYALALLVPTALHAAYNFPLFYADALDEASATLAGLLPLVTVAVVLAEAVWAHRLFFRLRALQREEQARLAAAAG
jgi:protease PrsW